MVEAPVLPCMRCGVPLALDPTAAAASCRHCGAATPVPEAAREAARAYNRRLREEGARLTFAERFGEDAVGKMIGAFTAIVTLLGVAFTLVQMAPAFLPIGASVRELALPVFLGVLGLSVVGLFIAIPLVGARALVEDDAVIEPKFQGGVRGVCAHCGAPVGFAVGQTESRCSHCGRHVIAAPHHHDALVALAAEQADLASARAGRSIQRDLAGGAVQLTFSVLEVVFFAVRYLMPGGMLVFTGVTLISSSSPRDPAGRFIALLGAGLVAAGAVVTAIVLLVVALVRRRSRGSALRRALAELAAAARGRVLGSGALPVLGWLDDHWAAGVPEPVITSANSDDGKPIVRWSTALVYQGRPALVVAAHAPHVQRIDVFLSAHRRRGPEAAQALASPDAAWARSAGFEPDVSNGGAHLAHHGSEPEHITPDRVAWLLDRASALVR